MFNRVGVLFVAAAMFLPACSGSSDSLDSNAAPALSSATSVTVVKGEPYRLSPDEAGDVSIVDIYVPEGSGPQRGVVLIHGKSEVAYPTPGIDLAPLAETIAGLGAVVFNFYWHTTDGLSVDSAEDLSCIGPFISARAAEFGVDPQDVVVVGHSMGGQTATMLAMRSFDLDPSDGCLETGDSANAVAVLGIGGTYSIASHPLDDEHSRFRTALRPGWPPVEAEADEEVAPGMTALDAYLFNPLSAIPPATDLRIVLLVGEIDYYPVTSPRVTAAFADALGSSGIQSEVVVMDGAGHEDIVDPNTEAGQTTLRLISGLISPLQ
jgi:pimeloyl-ACP methyl ester carboxylesterase